MKEQHHNKGILFTLSLSFLFVFLLSFYIGRFPVNPVTVMKILLSKILPIAQTWSDKAETVVINIRFPRIAGGALIGASLAIAGTIFQGIFNNPLVSPDILGSSQGAGLGAALSILFGAGSIMISINSFLVGLAAVLLALLASSKFKSNPHLGLILAGIMIGSLCQSGTSLVKLTADPTRQLPEITYWLMGSLASLSYNDLKLLVPIFLFAFVSLILCSWQLNLLTLDDNESKSLGINPNHFRIIIIVIVTLTTSVSVAVSGLIGWVGLVIPHLARRFCGSDFRKLIPGSALLGGAFLMLVDIFSRTLYTNEIPIGILTSFIGVPFFLFLLINRGKK